MGTNRAHQAAAIALKAHPMKAKFCKLVCIIMVLSRRVVEVLSSLVFEIMESRRKLGS